MPKCQLFVGTFRQLTDLETVIHRHIPPTNLLRSLPRRTHRSIDGAVASCCRSHRPRARRGLGRIREIVGLIGAFLRQERPPSVRPSAEMSFRNAVAVPKSYRIDEFRNARRRRQSRSPELAGYRFLIGGYMACLTTGLASGLDDAWTSDVRPQSSEHRYVAT